MAESGTWRENILRGATIILLGSLTAAFWRWADRLDQIDEAMRDGVELLQAGQTTVLVRIAKLEAENARQAERLDRAIERQTLHAERPWHNQAGRDIAVQSGAVERLRERLEKIEGR